ncbi:hypothetical protein LBMAG47_12460 [Planctomycetia bacterium]|nr:hypothetical protein LBMAG47_12460 [Planctomycetia bacterium]
MLDPAAVPDVGDEEILARFAIGKRAVRADGTLKDNELIPPPSGKLSVMRHLEATEQDIWDEGREVARLRAKELVGRIDLNAGECRRVGLQVIRAPLVADPPSKPEPRRRLANPNHADLVFPTAAAAIPRAPLPKADLMAIAKALVANGLRVIPTPIDTEKKTPAI